MYPCWAVWHGDIIGFFSVPLYPLEKRWDLGPKKVTRVIKGLQFSLPSRSMTLWSRSNGYWFSINIGNEERVLLCDDSGFFCSCLIKELLQLEGDGYHAIGSNSCSLINSDAPTCLELSIPRKKSICIMDWQQNGTFHQALQIKSLCYICYTAEDKIVQTM